MQRMEQLLDVTARLAGSSTLDAVPEIVIEQGIAALGGAYGGMWFLDVDGRALRLRAVSGRVGEAAERWTVVPIDLDAPLAHVARTSEPVFVQSLAEYAARFPASYERVRGTLTSDDVTYAMLPLVGKTTALGVLVVTYERANAIAAGDRAYLAMIARQCALAIERIRLHDAERTARLDAEEATRAREEILSVVSHDLRNPLGTILMGASTLMQLGDAADGDPKTARVRTIAERIHRQSERMARLIDDLVDFAGIQAGVLTIERRPTAPGAVLAAVHEMFAPIAQERAVTLVVDAPAELPTIEIDLDRAVQVIANLVANALKVTAKRGQITVGAAAQDGGELVFSVRDTGPGIEPEELSRLFERFWRSKNAHYKGAGLGLSIARGIVDAHGGRIWAESQVGAGARFQFTLVPRR